MTNRIGKYAVIAGAVGSLVLGLSAAATAQSTPKAPAKTHTSRAHPVAAARAALRNGTLSQSSGVSDVCHSNKLMCLAEVVTANKSSNAKPLAFEPPIGYGANELERAYAVTGSPSTTGTIVVIGAGAYPTLNSDLSIYRETYGLPPCTKANGCFKQMNYLGGKPYQPAKNFFDQFGEEEIAVETALDTEMASAACPKCKIISMQVPLTDGFYGGKKHLDTAVLHFATGVQTAHSQGASAVSISYGYPTDKYTDGPDIRAMMTVPGMAIVSSSGDYGFQERYGQWPQSLPTVTSAGGTSLYPASKGPFPYTEVAWNGAGSDCTPDLPPAEGQPDYVSINCNHHRTASDISAVSDPYTGVAVYDTYAPATGEPYGFVVVGGTSVASPFLGGLYARAGVSPSTVGPNTVYAAKPSAFHDITEGTNAGLGYCSTVNIGDAVCDAGPGWDGPTGLGTPRGLRPFTSS